MIKIKQKKLGVKSNFLWNIGNYSFSVASLFFIFPFLINNIGEADYGFFIFLGTINGLASVANFGFGDATQRYIAIYYSKNDLTSIKNILFTSLVIYTVIGLIVGGIMFGSASWISQLLREKNVDNETAIFLIRLSSATFILRFIFGIFSVTPQAFQRFDISAKIGIGETILRIFFYFFVVNYGFGLLGLVLVELCLAVLFIFVCYLVNCKIFNKLWFLGKFSKYLFKQLFGYSIYAALTQIVGLLWQYTDRILLGFYLGSAAIAYFSVPQQILFKVLGILGAGAAVLFPKFSVESIDFNAKEIFKRYMLLFSLLSIVVFSTMSLILPDFLTLWISPEFSGNSRGIAVILGLSCMIRGAFPVYENFFKGIGKPIYNLYIVIGSSLTILAIDVFMIPLMGLDGAGLAYLLSPWVGLLTIYLIYRLGFKESIKEPLFMFIIPLTIGYTVLFISQRIKGYLNFDESWGVLCLNGLVFSVLLISILRFYFFLLMKWRYHDLSVLKFADIIGLLNSKVKS